MPVLFTSGDAIFVRFACIIILPLGIFLSLALYLISGVQWVVGILALLIVLPCLYWLFSHDITYVVAGGGGGGGGLPVQQPPVPQVTPPSHVERLRRQRGGGATHGLSASVIAALPAYAYEKGSADECAVCLGELQRGEAVKQLPACAHLFHDVCIDVWLRSHVTCPVCRSAVDTAALPGAAEGVVQTQ